MMHKVLVTGLLLSGLVALGMGACNQAGINACTAVSGDDPNCLKAMAYSTCVDAVQAACASNDTFLDMANDYKANATAAKMACRNALGSVNCSASSVADCRARHPDIATAASTLVSNTCTETAAYKNCLTTAGATCGSGSGFKTAIDTASRAIDTIYNSKCDVQCSASSVADCRSRHPDIATEGSTLGPGTCTETAAYKDCLTTAGATCGSNMIAKTDIDAASRTINTIYDSRCGVSGLAPLTLLYVVVSAGLLLFFRLE